MIVFYVSAHGFGHASRQMELIRALQRLRPELPIEVRTSAPAWLFDPNLAGRVRLRATLCDTGAVQRDSLTVDVTGTLRSAAAFHADLDARADAEAAALRAARARLVVFDVPALAPAAAARANVPSFAVSNFTWDWIYTNYDEHATEAPGLVAALGRAYRQASGAWRLPMWGGFETFASIEDVPFIARRAKYDRVEVRRRLRVPIDRPLVLFSFGGYGLEGLAWDVVATLGDYTVVNVEASKRAGANTTAAAWRPASAGPSQRAPNDITVEQLAGAGLHYEDLVAASDVVITKPGYGILSECIAHETAVLYTSRGRFAEYDVLVRDLPRFARCRFISQDELRAGRWGSHLEALLAQPPPPERAATNGAEVVAGKILDAIE